MIVNRSYYISLCQRMSKSLAFKGTVKDYGSYFNDRKKVEQEAESIKEPEKKHGFSEQAREANKSKYQQLRKKT